MPALTRSTLVTRIADLISDPNNTRWTAAQKQARIEEWQVRFVLDTRCLRTNTAHNVQAGTREYSLPSDLLFIERVTLNGIELRQIDRKDVDFYTNSNWATQTGTPTYYYADLNPGASGDGYELGLIPIPTANDAGSSNLTIEYTRHPPALSSDSSVPFSAHELLYPYHTAIAYGAAADFLRSDPTPENMAKIREFEREYEKLVTHCINYFRSMYQSKPLRIKGGRYFKGM